MFDHLNDAANLVAAEYVPHVFPKFSEFHVTVVRNAVLDCLTVSDEPDFIAKICAHPMHGGQARHIVKKVAPDLIGLAAEVIEKVQKQ